MRSLSSALLVALSNTITNPGFLVTIAFASGTLHLTSRADVTIDGQPWYAADIELSGLGADAKGEQRGSLRLGNTDGAFGAIVLNEANADWSILVDVYDAGAVAPGDPVRIFDGIGNGAAIDERSVTIDLTSARTSTQFVPAEYITAEQGFSFLPPAGMRIVTPTSIYTLGASRV